MLDLETKRGEGEATVQPTTNKTNTNTDSALYAKTKSTSYFKSFCLVYSK